MKWAYDQSLWAYVLNIPNKKTQQTTLFQVNENEGFVWIPFILLKI